MKTHIIDALRPEAPTLDPDWEAETVRAILKDRSGEAKFTTNRRGRLTRVALIAAAVVTLIGGAVVARNSLPSDDVRPAKPVQKKIQTIDPSKATKLKLDVVADLPQTFNGDPVLFSAFAEDDIVLGSTISTKAEAIEQSHPVMYNLDTKKFTQLDATRDRPEPTQVAYVSGNENTVIWVELVGTDVDTSDFTFYSYDRRTKRVTTIGEFNDPEGQIVYNNDLALFYATAYFSTFALPEKKGQEAVYAMPVDGSKPPRVIADGGQDVRISGDTLTYALRKPTNPDDYPRYFIYDLRTGGMRPAPVSAHADDPGFCGAEFSETWETWCVGHVLDGADPSTASYKPARLTIKEALGRTTKFAPFPTSISSNPVPHDIIDLGRWTAITVTADGGQDRKYLVDLDTKEMKVFPDNTSFTALSPDGSTVLISSFAGNGPGPQRLVRIPD